MNFDVSGDAYDRFMGRYSLQLAPAFADFAGVETGQRVVDVGCGTGVLTDGRKQPDLGQMQQLVAQLATLHKQGKEIVVVSSGAVGAGMGLLGHTKRPADLAELQACAAVGQSRLMAIYEKLFAQFEFFSGVSPSLCRQGEALPVCLAQERYAQAR